MAFTANSISVVPTPTEGGWVWASIYIANLSDAEDAVAAVTGKCIYVQKIQIFSQSVTDITFDIGAAQGTGVTTIYIGPVPMPDAGGSVTIDFGPDHCMKVASATALSMDASASCPVSLLIKYKIAS